MSVRRPTAAYTVLDRLAEFRSPTARASALEHGAGRAEASAEAVGKRDDAEGVAVAVVDLVDGVVVQERVVGVLGHADLKDRAGRQTTDVQALVPRSDVRERLPVQLAAQP